jgi:hypothetical protein
MQRSQTRTIGEHIASNSIQYQKCIQQNCSLYFAKVDPESFTMCLSEFKALNSKNCLHLCLKVLFVQTDVYLVLTLKYMINESSLAFSLEKMVWSNKIRRA